MLAAGNVNAKLVQARAALDQSRKSAFTSQPTPQDFPIIAGDWRALFQHLTGIDLAACPDCGAVISIEPLLDSEHPARAPPPSSPPCPPDLQQ